MSNQNQPDSNIDQESYNPDHSSQNEFTVPSHLVPSLFHCPDKRCKLPFTNIIRHKELHANFDLKVYVCEIADEQTCPYCDIEQDLLTKEERCRTSK